METQMNKNIQKCSRPKLPPWIRVKVNVGGGSENVASVLEKHSLNTVCQSARCPNLAECWHKRQATFMILGNQCTRSCKFCAVEHSSSPPLPCPDEPHEIAEAARELGLGYVVVTSVTRDDLPDGGASVFARTICEIRKIMPNAGIEVLVPDFKGNDRSIRAVIEAAPTVFNHNVETVERLTPLIRSGANYRRSLKVLESAFEMSEGRIPVKSGIMLGLGETDDEVLTTIADIRASGTEILTIGQYLPPRHDSWKLDRYVEPEKFASFKEYAIGLGFRNVASSPLVRSSYHAEDSYLAISET